MARTQQKFKNPAGVKSGKFQYARGWYNETLHPSAVNHHRDTKWENVGPKQKASRTASLKGRARGKAYDNKMHGIYQQGSMVESAASMRAKDSSYHRRTGFRWERQSGVGFHRNTKGAGSMVHKSATNYLARKGAEHAHARKVKIGVGVGAAAVGVGGYEAYKHRAQLKNTMHAAHEKIFHRTHGSL